VAAHAGGPRELRAAAEAGAVLRAQDALESRRAGAWVAALVADAEGDPGAAAAAMGDTVAALGGPGPPFAREDPCDLLVLLRMLLRAGDLRGAEAVAEEAGRRTRATPDAVVLALVAAHARALLDRDASSVRASASALAVLPGPVARAELLEDVADVLRVADRDAAVATSTPRWPPRRAAPSAAPPACAAGCSSSGSAAAGAPARDPARAGAA
jgi:hypothetical protein